MTHLRLGGSSPGNKNAPRTGILAGGSNTDEVTAGLVYHNPEPSSFPRTRLHRTRRGWELIRWDGFGRIYRWFFRYRYEAHRIIDEIASGHLAADITVRGIN